MVSGPNAADKRRKAERNQFAGFDPDGKRGQRQEPWQGPEPRHEVGWVDKTLDLPAGAPGDSRTVSKGECPLPDL